MNTPTPHFYDIANARALAGASEMAYAANVAGVSQIEDYASETRVVILDQGDDLIIAFRGTTDLKNWLTDLNALWMVYTLGGKNVLVHHGFYRAWMAVREKVLAAVKAALAANPKARIWLTGHSLGGALAMLAFEQIQLAADGRVVGCYTFGQPRVGNKAFIAAFLGEFELASRYFRTVHANDIVPRQAGALLGYRHACHEIWYLPPLDGQNGEWYLTDTNWFTHMFLDAYGLIRGWYKRQEVLVAEHGIGEYIKALGPISRKQSELEQEQNG